MWLLQFGAACKCKLSCRFTKLVNLYSQGPSSSPVRRVSGSSGNSNSAVKGTSHKTPSPSLKGVDPKLAQIILDEILEGGASVQWEDIAGQEVPLTNLNITVIACMIKKICCYFLISMHLTPSPHLDCHILCSLHFFIYMHHSEFFECTL